MKEGSQVNWINFIYETAYFMRLLCLKRNLLNKNRQMKGNFPIHLPVLHWFYFSVSWMGKGNAKHQYRIKVTLFEVFCQAFFIKKPRFPSSYANCNYIGPMLLYLEFYQCGGEQRDADNRFDDFREHKGSVVDDGEHPCAVLMNNMCGIVRIPFQVKCVPDNRTGNNMAQEAEKGNKEGTENGGDNKIERFILGEADVPKYAAHAKNGKRNKVVKQDTENDTACGGNPRNVADTKDKLQNRVHKSP